MQTVDIVDLKAHLSAYLACARAGEELVICEDDLPFARMVPFSEVASVAAQTAGTGSTQEDLGTFMERFNRMPLPVARGNGALTAMLEEREEGL